MSEETPTPGAPPEGEAASSTERREDEVNEPAGEEPGPEASFERMNLHPEVLRALGDMGYERPMEVQHVTFDPIESGKDVIVQARTGTGKTAAFGIPLAHRLHGNSRGVQGLVLTPTRELALQVARELQAIALHKGLQVVAIYGGAPMKPQVDALYAGAQIVVGTPGRLLDHIGRGTLDTRGVSTFILDECDEMLSMGFQEEIERIIEVLPPKGKRQTLLFSATIPESIQRIARRHMIEPESVSLSSGGISVEEIEHHYFLVSGMARTRDLLKVLTVEKPNQAIIFCNTRDDTNLVARFLQKQGYVAEALSSDLSQRDRELTMGRMREGKLKYLVATDLAARGIDLDDVTHVINYNFPESPEVYVHRTGRTGRAGKRGTAISLIGPRDIGAFYFLKLTYKIRPQERDLPSNEDFATMIESERFERIVELVPEESNEEFRSLARRVMQSEQGERVVGALLQRVINNAVPRQPPRPERGEDDAAGYGGGEGGGESRETR
ncbi:MAG TPA: DEAD/DEAH box helicase, partial [Kofleriaceae bacterium]|nr:DEAD/DEAH box helicase [Kofleriaceae bacterium]